MFTTMWGPSVISWFINPMNAILISTINHSYWSYVAPNLAIERGPHIVWLMFAGQILVGNIFLHNPCRKLRKRVMEKTQLGLPAGEGFLFLRDRSWIEISEKTMEMR